MKWTKEQERAINLRGKNILVSAAAGSGKTSVLVERIRKLVSEEKTPIREFLVVTFTNAAASEMKERLRKSLAAELKNEDDPEKIKYLRRQILDLETANISTFHAFGLSVIRRFFYKLNVEPGFRMADETETGIMKERAVNDLLEREFEEFNQDFISFIDSYSSDRNINRVKKLILDAHKRIMTMPEPWDWMEEKILELENLKEEGSRGIIWDEVRRNINESLERAGENYEAAATLLDESGLDDYASLIRNNEISCIHNMMEAVNSNGNPGEIIAKLDLKMPKTTTIRSNPENKEVLGEIKDRLDKYRGSGRDILKKEIKDVFLSRDYETNLKLSSETAPYLRTLKRLVYDFDCIYKKIKAEDRVIDFEDIEHYCYEALGDQEVSDYYRNSISHIFIDEYQDTNLMQEAIIDRIKRENNLFMVGDIKQSIYRFRLAEPSIFREKYLNYRDGRDEHSEVIDLNKNHRSKSKIIDYINKVFTPLMDGYDERSMLYYGQDYKGELDYEPSLKVVLPMPEDMRDELPDFYSDEDDEIILEEDLTSVEREAFYVAGEIKNVLGKPFYDIKMDPPGVRPVELKDIAVLRRSVASVSDIYQEIFKLEGIPSSVQGDDGYFNTVEIESFVDLLTVIDNGRRDIPFIGLLHSDIFGYSPQDLAEVRLWKRDGSFTEAFRDLAENNTENMGDRAKKVLETINSWRKMAREMPLPKFLWELLLDSGAYSLMGALPGGDRRQANLRALCDMAERYSKDRQVTLYDFLFYIESIKKGNLKMPEARDDGKGQDRVKIMTVHKSKGLEFPVVILSGLGKRIGGSSPEAFSMHKDLGLGIDLVNRSEHWKLKPLSKYLVDARSHKEDLDEEIRVLYVAMTRARDRLILIAHQDNENFRESAEMGIIAHGKYLDMVAPSVPYVMDYLNPENELATEREKERKRLNPEDRKRILEILNYKYPYSSARDLKSKYSVSELNREADTEIVYGDGNRINGDRADNKKDSHTGRPKGKLTAAERGTIYHKIMEHLSFGSFNGKSEDDVDELFFESLDNMIKYGFISGDELDGIDESKILSFLKSPMGKRCITADSKGLLQKEREFTLKMERANEDILVQGIIDCFFIEERENKEPVTVLLDYKSNWINPNLPVEEEKRRLKNEYKTQIDIYRNALEKAGLPPVAESYLYLLDLGKEGAIEM